MKVTWQLAASNWRNTNERGKYRRPRSPRVGVFLHPFDFSPKWDFSQFIMKRKRISINRSEMIYLSLLIESLRVFFILVMLLSCFVECFYLVCSEIGVSCQKWVTPYPWWHSVGVAKLFIRITVHVGIFCNVQVMLYAKRRSKIWLFIQGIWTTAVELREFARVSGRVFQWKQEGLWIILISSSTS